MPMPVAFSKTEIDGVLEVKTGVVRDCRGFFCEAYSKPVWEAQGFPQSFLQDSMSLSVKGALRGMHYQLEPHGMGKLVRVLTGAVFDVAVDIRRGSPTFGKWVGRVLSGENQLALWIPAGFAHGFEALERNSIVYYKSTSVHAPESERSLSYRDPVLAIAWPIEPAVVSDKDAAAPLLAQAEYNFVYGGQCDFGSESLRKSL